ncbi:MAG: ATP-binding protein [Pseudomonadota bacterium]
MARGDGKGSAGTETGHRRVRWPLSIRFLALLVPVVAVVLVPALTIPPYLEFRRQIVELDDKLDRIIENQSVVISRAVAGLDKRMAGLVMAGVFSDRDIVFAEILTRDDEVVLRLGEPPEEGAVQSRPVQYVSGDRVIGAGTVRMGISYARARATFGLALGYAAGTALLAVAAVVIATWLIFSAIIGNRLFRLQRAMSRWREGAPELAEARQGTDEIAHLCRTFDELQEARRGHELSLEDIKGDLERRVEERTIALREARDAAERASSAKADFLAAVSHEIRTPLNAILGLAGTLCQGADPVAERHKLALLKESGEGLRMLLDDVLDLSKAEAGHMAIEPTPEDAAALLETICAFWREEAESKGLTLTLEVEEPAAPVLMVDALRLRQAVGNLLSNAVKFTDSGGIRVRLSATPLPETDRWTLAVRVSDTGIGMSEETLQRLFHAFEQGDSSITRRFGGTGLGLALTRHLVGLMDGRIDVESTLGDGSSFMISLPLDAAEPAEAETALDTIESNSRRLDGCRVLVVDDVATNRLVARLMLEPLGATVLEAPSGENALEQLASTTVDLVLVDLHMPMLDGVAMVSRMRASPALAALPVLLLTADATAEIDDDARALAIAGVVMKPVDPDELYNACFAALARSPVPSAAE